jgi:signal transduction histidine kinase
VSRVPIRLRVTAAFALAMAAVLACTGLYLYLQLGSNLTASLNRDLRLRAQDLAALAGRPGTTLAQDNSGRLVERGESYVQLLTPEGRVVDATRPLGRTPLLSRLQLRRAERAPIYVDRPSVPGLNEGSRLLATRVTRSGQPAVLVVGATRQNNVETLGNFRDELLIAGPLALLFASGVGYLLAGLSLRQVESMRRRAAAISGETPSERLPVAPTGDEVERLGETLNEMLDRLQAALERERDFVADAGHELRTPLALLRTELELAQRQAETTEELRAAIRRSSQEADRLTQLAEALLLIARADRGRLPLRLESVEVESLFGSICNRFEWRAAELGKTLRSAPTNGLRVAADPIRLEQALGNLVDNALRYGGDRVTLEARRHAGNVELHVRDSGLGLPADFLPRAFDRFARADAARGRGGSGLGLSIVKTIAESHAGTAHIAKATTGGADAWMSIPSVSTSSSGAP